MKLGKVVAIQQSLDYITIVSHNAEGAALLDRVGWGMVEVAEDEGGIIKSMLVGGYDGYQLNNVFYGHRYDGAMLKVSGPQSLEVARQMNWNNVHVTRIDLQITVWLENHDIMLAEAGYEEATKFREENPKKQLAHPVLIVGGEKGSTLMLGSRSSPRYGRCYDKWLESGDDAYFAAWRFEVEYKAQGSKEALEALVRADWADTAIAGMVKGQWEHWGVPMDFVGVASIVPVTFDRRKSDIDKKLQWLRDQVAPTVRQLKDKARLVEVLEALGIDKSDVWC